MSNCCSKSIDKPEPGCCSATASKKGLPVAFSISGMTCDSCKKTIEGVLSGVSGVESVDVDLNSNRALITGSFSVDDVINVTRKAGYIAELIAASAGTKPSSEKANKTGCCCR